MRDLKILWESVKMAFRNIRNNRVRSLLTMVGIIIGVSSVITMITYVQATSDKIMNELHTIEGRTISVTVFTGSSVKGTGLTSRDLDVFDIPSVEAVSPIIKGKGSAVFKSAVYTIQIQGRSDAYFKYNDLIAEGRAFTADEIKENAYVCVVNRDFVANVLGGRPAENCTVLLNGIPYKIVGVMKKDTSFNAVFSGGAMYADTVGAVTVPYGNALSLLGKASIEELDVYAYDGEDMDEVQDAVNAALLTVYETDDGYMLNNRAEEIKSSSETQRSLTSLVGGIASIALLVGGIGIMNMMLVSVTECTREIGIRKALGAKPSRIQMQFLIESIILSVFGGGMGVVFGIIGAIVIERMNALPFTISWGSIFLGAGFSILVGVVFGWVPAQKASKLSPIDALRAD